MQYIALAAFAGFLTPLQALVNARTSQVFGGPLMATLINFAGGTIMVLVALAVVRAPFPTGEQIARVPHYAWFSGLVGVIFVGQAAFTVPKLGAASMIAIVITGQLVASMVFDHFGVLQQAHPISLQKIMGALLLLGGMWLILRPGQ